ncbi:MAG: hypothetical protein U0V75_01370 [Ferruginibacter sp.]
MLKKLFINIFLVLVTVFILDNAVGRLLRHFYFTETSGLNYRTTYSLDSAKPQVLIIGSSRANHHYIPAVFEAILNKTVYNSGRDGNGTFYQLSLMKTVLKRYTPEIIIIEYSSVFTKGKEEYDQLSSLLPYYCSHPEIRPIVQLRSPYERVKMLSQVYPFNSQLFTIAVGNLELNKQRYKDYQGYVPLHNTWKHPLDSAADTKDIPLDSLKVNAFKECLELAKAKGVKVLVVFSPIFQKYNYNQQVSVCSKICSDHQIPFWDYSKDTGFIKQPPLFQDILHLNEKGAILFSNMVANRIKETVLANN